MPVILPPAAGTLPFAAPGLDEALLRLRRDLFDQVQTSARWGDDDLRRALDRALDQYSFVAPWVRTALLPAVSGSRLYALPGGAQPMVDAGGVGGVSGSFGAGPDAGPAGAVRSWWLETVEYPTGRYPRRLVGFRELLQPGLGVPPAPVVAPAGVGPLTGTYSYAVTWLGIAGETVAGPPSAPIAPVGQGASVALPPGPAPYTAGWRLYRTPASGAAGSLLLVATIGGNVATSYMDVVPDSALGASPPVGDGTAGVPLIELDLPEGLLPGADDPGTLAVSYAGKHRWDASGTTVPEAHHDVVLLGAAAYACLAYQVPTNDLFEYQDGALHDRISEIKTPEHWLAAGNNLLAAFKARLEEVRRQRDGAAAAVARWGGVPARWGWI